LLFEYLYLTWRLHRWSKSCTIQQADFLSITVDCRGGFRN